MNWKKLLKIAAIGLSSVIVVLGILGVWLLTKLPGPSLVKNVIQSSQAQLQQKANHSAKTDPTQVKAAEDDTDTAQNENTEHPSTSNQKPSLDLKTVIAELGNPERPLVDACRDLARAGESGFFPRKSDRSAVKFFDNIANGQKDPVLETVAPLLRYVFRAPGMNEILKLAEASKGDDSLIQKAELYGQLLQAVNYLRANTAQMNQLVQKSYNMHMLTKAVALKPQLANDNATVSFCEQMQKSLTDNQDLNVEEQVQEMQKFLHDSEIDPKSIGFNPAYRARVQSEFKENSFTITDPWLKELFSKGLM